MKIRTAKDVEILDQRINEELGIDVRKYKDEDVVESFFALLVFPEYVVNWVIRPILIAIVLYVIGFYIFDLVHIEYFIYGFFGFSLFFTTGLVLGLLFLTKKIKKDLWGIINYSLDIMKSAVNDLNQMNSQINVENRKDVLGLLFNGIIHIVTIPMMSKIISEKIPFIGGIINRFIKKVLTLISDMVSFQQDSLKQEIMSEEHNILEIYSKSISSASAGLEKATHMTFRIAQFPLKLIFGISLLMLIAFVYLIN